MTRRTRRVQRRREQTVEDITPNVVASDETVDLTESPVENLVSSSSESSDVNEEPLEQQEENEELWDWGVDLPGLGTTQSMQTEPEHSEHSHSQGEAPRREPEVQEPQNTTVKVVPKSPEPPKETNPAVPESPAVSQTFVGTDIGQREKLLEAQLRQFQVEQENLRLKQQLLELREKALEETEKQKSLEKETAVPEESAGSPEKGRRKRQRYSKPEREAFEAQKKAAAQAAQAKPVSSPIQTLRGKSEQARALKNQGPRAGQIGLNQPKGRGGKGKEQATDPVPDQEDEQEDIPLSVTYPEAQQKRTQSVRFTEPEQTAAPEKEGARTADQAGPSHQTDFPEPFELKDLAAHGDTLAAEVEVLRHDFRKAVGEPARYKTDTELFERSNREQKEVWLGLGTYKQAISGALINHNLHTTTHDQTHVYFRRVNDYAHAGFPPGLLHLAPFTWLQTCQVELNAAWLSQTNVQLGVLRRIKETKIAGRLNEYVDRLLKIHERLLLRYEEDLKKGLSKEECQPYSIAKLSVPTESLVMGEKLIRAVHLLTQ